MYRQLRNNEYTVGYQAFQGWIMLGVYSPIPQKFKEIEGACLEIQVTNRANKPV